MITICNDKLKVSINENGGSMCSIMKNGIEYQWQGSKESWEGQDVVIFPFVARLKDGFYLYEDKKYELLIHGLCRYTKLDILEKGPSFVTMSLKWNEETLKRYPYKFEFYLKYSINNETLKVEYKVKNVDDKTIYFGLGGHPAFSLPYERKNGIDEIDGNYIEFEKPLNLANYMLEETGCFIVGKENFGEVSKIELNKALFEKYNTIMLTGAKFSSLKLVRKDGVSIKMDVSDFPIHALWTKPKLGAYICIEPWTSIPDMNYPNRELKDKPTIQSLDVNQEKTYSYTIQI